LSEGTNPARRLPVLATMKSMGVASSLEACSLARISLPLGVWGVWTIGCQQGVPDVEFGDGVLANFALQGLVQMHC
jgi:hypothetical protein